MKTIGLRDGLAFDEDRPHAVPVHADAAGRVLRFTLRAGQRLKEHASPGSPAYLVVIEGEGLFAGGDGMEQRLGPGFLAILDPGEAHSVRALDGDLVVVAILHGEPTARPGAVPGTMTS